MIFRSGPTGSAVLEDAYNFRAFEVRGVPDASLGRIDGDHVFIDPETVVALAGGAAGDPGWRNDFSDMIAYAAKQGWVDEKGAIRAHLAER